ncbi:uncharacterized protein LOC144983648 [Oryzias latipes]
MKLLPPPLCTWVGDSFRTTASSFIPEGVTAIWDGLVGDFMAAPPAEDWSSTAEDVHQRRTSVRGGRPSEEDVHQRRTSIRGGRPSSFIPEGVDAIWDSLVGDLMAAPPAEDWSSTAEDVHQRRTSIRGGRPSEEDVHQRRTSSKCCGSTDNRDPQISSSVLQFLLISSQTLGWSPAGFKGEHAVGAVRMVVLKPSGG